MDADELPASEQCRPFRSWTRKRSSFGWTLAIVMVAVYGRSSCCVAFAR